MIILLIPLSTVLVRYPQTGKSIIYTGQSLVKISLLDLYQANALGQGAQTSQVQSLPVL